VSLIPGPRLVKAEGRTTGCHSIKINMVKADVVFGTTRDIQGPVSSQKPEPDGPLITTRRDITRYFQHLRT